MGIEIRNLSKSYGNKLVIDDLSLDIRDFSFNIITGPSGCGKTTLLRLLLGLEKANSGSVICSFSNPAVVFQENRLSESFSALENVNISFKSSSNQSETILSALGLADVCNKRVSELSGGMKRRVALARALVADSDIILLDEPFKGLDDATKHSVIDAMLKFTKNKTVIMVTHDRDEISYISSMTVVNNICL